jgi:hypothetical protein
MRFGLGEVSIISLIVSVVHSEVLFDLFTFSQALYINKISMEQGHYSESNRSSRNFLSFMEFEDL